MAGKGQHGKALRRKNLTRFFLGILVIILLNIIGTRVFTRIDLTAEKRYSIASSTKDLLRNLDDVIFVKVYLEGDLPAEMKKLRNATREMLDEFRAYNRDIEYTFINPYESDDQKDQQRLFAELMDKGIEATNIQQRTEDGVSSKLIFPGAVISYRNREMPIQLLQSQENMGVSSDDQVNHSIEALEYNLANAIRKLSVVEKPKIAFTGGHGELGEMDVADITASLSEYYNVNRVELDGKLLSVADRDQGDSVDSDFHNKFEALIIAKPTLPFSRQDQFVIDQFIMRGGKVLWLIDPVSASLDSLQNASETMGVPINLDLQNMLSSYGVRVNPDLIQDVTALPLPVNVAPYGSEPKWEFYPWFFSPILLPEGKHPIVRNLDAIKTEFISSIDTISSSKAKKTILLWTSEYSRTLVTPVRISLDILGKMPDERDFNRRNIPVAVLLEGSFQSMFRFRLVPGFTDNPSVHFREESSDTRMIVVSDGDIIRNQLRMANGQLRPMKLGFDRYTGRTFANSDFILNGVNYLCDDAGLLELRSRELKLRLLDPTKIKDSKRVKWQVLNVVLPAFILILAGMVIVIVRRFRFRKQTNARQ